MDKNEPLHAEGRLFGTLGLRCVIAGILALLSLPACARLGPTIGHETSDAQVTVDSLRSAVRDGQRMTADLRTELADRRKELADVHVARAQLEGMLRETERRLAEARQIIELQREELDAARADRLRIEESGRQLHSRLRRLEKLLAQARRQRETGEIMPSGYVPPEPPLAAHPAKLADTLGTGSMPAMVGAPQGGSEDRIVVVREGETLWRLARRHQVDLDELRQLNGLHDNRIVTGWTLRLPASMHAAGRSVSGSRRILR